jgi:thioredoxin 1
MVAEIEAIDEARYTQLLSEPSVKVVYFWAPWCGPCKMFSKVFSGFASSYGDKASFHKMNTDENENFVRQIGVRSVPTIAILKGSEVIDIVVGAVPSIDRQMLKAFESN